MTILVGMDLATQSGICYGRPDVTPVVQVVRAPVTGRDLGRWGAFYVRYFNSLFGALNARLQVGETIVVCYEAPILIPDKIDRETGKLKRMTNIATTRKLQGLGMVLETVCTLLREDEGYPINVIECHIATIKRELGGHGGAPKGDLVYVARRAGIVLPDGEEAKDGADSFGAWYVGCRERTPEHLSMWDRRIHSSYRP